MKGRLRFVGLAASTAIILGVIGVALAAVWPGQARSNAGPEAPDVFASPINGGCYIAAPNDCRIHIDPFAINIATGKRLVSFRLQSNGATIYDFTTDVSNPPPTSGTTYSPSLVMQDFAAVCGRTYQVNILGKDSGDANFLNMGQTAQFTCPSTVP